MYLARDVVATCPSCGTQFQLSEVLRNEIQGEIDSGIKKKEDEMNRREDSLNKRESEIQSRIKEGIQSERKNIEKDVRKELESEYESRYDKEKEDLKSEVSQKDQQIEFQKEKNKDLTKKNLELLKKEQDLDFERSQIPVKVAEEVTKEKKKWETTYGPVVAKQYETEIGQLKSDKTALNLEIDRYKKNIDDLSEQLKQKSPEFLGEVQEMTIEGHLKSAFSGDEIMPVPKGEKGADIIQIVKNSKGETLGSIVWESKNAKTWQEKWLSKLMSDKNRIKGNYGVLVSTVMPKDVTSFTAKNGLIIIKPDLVFPIGYTLRWSLSEVFSATIANKDRSGKEADLYNFITGNDFRNLVQASATPIFDMLQDLNKERTAMEKIWRERETRLRGSLRSIGDAWGVISGIVKVSDIPVFSPESQQIKQIDDGSWGEKRAPKEGKKKG